MVELSTQSCEACRIDAPRVSEEEISSLMLDKVFKYKKVIPVGSKKYTKVSLYEKMLPSVVIVWVSLENQ